MICPNCKFNNRTSANVCSRCGQRLPKGKGAITRDTPLGEILFRKGDTISDPAWKKIRARPVVGVVFAGLSIATAGVVEKDIRESIGRLFQKDLLCLLLEGWSQCNEVAQCLAISRQKPKDIINKELLKHTFKSVQHPYVELFVDEKSVGRIQFEVMTALEVAGLNLKFLNGRICEIAAGTCEGSVELTCEGVRLAKEKTGKVALPGAVRV